MLRIVRLLLLSRLRFATGPTDEHTETQTVESDHDWAVDRAATMTSWLILSHFSCTSQITYNIYVLHSRCNLCICDLFKNILGFFFPLQFAPVSFTCESARVFWPFLRIVLCCRCTKRSRWTALTSSSLTQESLLSVRCTHAHTHAPARCTQTHSHTLHMASQPPEREGS